MSTIEGSLERDAESASPSVPLPPTTEQIQRMRSSVLRSIALDLQTETDGQAAGYAREPYDRSVYFRSRD